MPPVSVSYFQQSSIIFIVNSPRSLATKLCGADSSFTPFGIDEVLQCEVLNPDTSDGVKDHKILQSL